MSSYKKRATIYFDQKVHKILKMKSASCERSISDLVNDVVRQEFLEDADDLETFDSRVNEPTVSYETMIKKLKEDGKI